MAADFGDVVVADFYGLDSFVKRVYIRLWNTKASIDDRGFFAQNE